MMDYLIIKLPVNYEQERINKEDNNKGFLYGVYYYNVPVEDLNSDNIFNNDIINVEWFKTEEERNETLNNNN